MIGDSTRIRIRRGPARLIVRLARPEAAASAKVVLGED
jgi:hypothetical protein